MTTQVSSRQCIIFIIISIFAMKLQGCFALISSEVGSDGLPMLLFFLAFDIMMLLAVIRIIKLYPNVTFYEFLKQNVGAVIAKIIIGFFAIYFICKAIIPYKGIHDLFSNVLFEYLPWPIFSILLVLTLLFMMSKGLKGLGRTAELFIWIIGFGLIGCGIISVTVPDYSRLLPFMESNVKTIFDGAVSVSMWFADFLLLFMLMGKVDKNMKYKKVVIWYLIAGAFVCVLFSIFYALYDKLSIFQYQGLASLTEYSFLGLDFGRIDQILVLFSFISTVIATSVYLFIASSCISNIFNTKSNRWFSFFVVAVVYVIDVFVASQISALVQFYTNILCYFAIFMQVILPIILLFVAKINNWKRKKKILLEEKYA